MKFKILKNVVLIYMFLFVINYSQIKVQNSRNEIKNSENKIKLELLNKWGNEDEETENVVTQPIHIQFDSNENIYILDNTRKKIFVYDKNRKFVKTIFSKGNGPREIYATNDFIIDEKDNIALFEDRKQTLEIYTNEGKYKSFKVNNTTTSISYYNGKIYSLSFMPYPNQPLVSVFNFKGEKEFGYLNVGSFPKGQDIKKVRQTFNAMNDRYLALTKNGELILANKLLKSEMIVVNQKGDTEKIIKYDLPYQTDEFPLEKIVYGLSSDDGKIYLVVKRRLETKEERNSWGGFIGNNKVSPKFSSENTDLFKLLVFNENGKIIASKNLDVFCQKIFVHNNKLYIIDHQIAQVIYEYNIKFTN